MPAPPCPPCPIGGCGHKPATGKMGDLHVHVRHKHPLHTIPVHLREGYEQVLGGVWQEKCCGDLWTGLRWHKCARELDKDGKYTKLRRSKSASSEGDRSSCGAHLRG